MFSPTATSFLRQTNTISSSSSPHNTPRQGVVKSKTTPSKKKLSIFYYSFCDSRLGIKLPFFPHFILFSSYPSASFLSSQDPRFHAHETHTLTSSSSPHTNTSANSLELFHHQEIAASSPKKIDPTDTKIALFAPKTQPIRTNSTRNRITAIHCTFCDTIRHQTRRAKREKVAKYPHLILTPCSTIQATNLCLVCAE